MEGLHEEEEEEEEEGGGTGAHGPNDGNHESSQDNANREVKASRAADAETEVSTRGEATEEEEHDDDDDDDDNEEEEEEDDDDDGGGGEEEEEEGDDDDENEDDEQVKEGILFRFGGKIDPLALAEEELSGIQPYQQFERLEYEALAAQKRKRAILQKKNTQEKSGLKKEGLFGVDVDEILQISKNPSMDPDPSTLDAIWEGFGYGTRRGRKRKRKRRKQKRKSDPEITKKLGEANLLYAMGQYEQALHLLQEVICLVPNMPEPYHTMGLIYNSMGNRKKAISFYMLAAHLRPKDVSLWKRLTAWSLEEGLSTGQAIYCLKRAMKADQEDVLVKLELASFYAELKEYTKAAETYDAILALHPTDVEVCKMAAQMRVKSGRTDEAINTLRKMIDEHPTEADLTVVNLLADLYMEKRDFSSSISCLEDARRLYCAGQGLSVDLAVKAGICHAHLGNDEVAKEYFLALGKELAEEFPDLIMQVADTYNELKNHPIALVYYSMLDAITACQNKVLWTKMAECHLAMKEGPKAISLYHKALMDTPDDVELRSTLASVLIEMDKVEDALGVLTPPEDSNREEQSWWSDGKLVLMLAKAYDLTKSYDLYLDTIVPLLKTALEAELHNQNIKGGKKRLSKSVLVARAKWLDGLSDAFFHVNPIIPNRERTKAARAKKALAKIEAEKEEKRAAVLAAGLDWHSEEDLEPDIVEIEPKPQPLPNLFDKEEHLEMLTKVCKLLSMSKRYGEALEIINQGVKISHPNVVSKRAELRALGAEVTLKAKDTRHGYDCVRYMVQQQPYSVSAWNWYYQALSRLEFKVPKHGKFLLSIRNKYADCVPPMIICGHQFSMISQPQGALREYLQACKLQPEDPFINLCVGISLINLSLGFRLTNRNQCVLQGFAFLHKYQKLCEHSQESNYNLARAYHHIGFVTIAVHYYEKVLSCYEKHSTANVSNDSYVMSGSADEVMATGKEIEGVCDLRREAAYNLHLIYKKSGAANLARHLLQDYCSI